MENRAETRKMKASPVVSTASMGRNHIETYTHRIKEEVKKERKREGVTRSTVSFLISSRVMGLSPPMCGCRGKRGNAEDDEEKK